MFDDWPRPLKICEVLAMRLFNCLLGFGGTNLWSVIKHSIDTLHGTSVVSPDHWSFCRLTVHCWKNIVTVAKTTRRNMALVLKSEAAATNCSFIVDQEEPSDRCGKCSATVRFSNIDCALISRNSSSMRSWSCGRLRRLASVFRASTSRLWWTSHLGEKGCNRHQKIVWGLRW